MKQHSKHIAELAKRDYILGIHETIGFNSDELRLLIRYGNWLEALVEGKIQAHTDAQLRFIAVDEKQLKPETSFEIAWMKLKGRRDFERFKDSSEEAPKQSGYCSCCHRQLSNKPINRSCPECMKSRSHMPQPSGNDWDHWDYSAIK